MPGTGKVTVTEPPSGSGSAWSKAKPAGKEALVPSPHVPSVMLDGVQGKIAEVNVPLKLVVRNSTVPPTGTTVTEGSNHLPGTSVSVTNVDCAKDVPEPSVSTATPRTKSINRRT